MAANKLEWRNAGRTPIPLTKREASVLAGFRRSTYADSIKEILLAVLDEARITYETNPSTEENRMRVAAAKEVVDILFEGKVVEK